ncbi:MAG: DUF1624 domain-containing protein [Lachnospiraceae bacterium]|nr:DUF1624 domain-containing protein [Lachnospiraceae bacterium]
MSNVAIKLERDEQENIIPGGKSGQVPRYHLLDALRGCILISMFLYHGTWDLVYIFGVKMDWFQSAIAHVWQQSICWGFILLSGFCWHLGSNKWKRGLQVFLAGAVITGVTYLFMRENIIIFGVLTLLGSCMLLMIGLDKLLRKWNCYIGAIFFFALFFLTRNVNRGFLGFETWNLLPLPQEWYANELTTYLGFMEPGFFSTDYFSLIPWVFLFITGYYLHGIVMRGKVVECLNVSVCRWLQWMGRNSLLLYMLHQPALYGILCVVDYLVR